MAQNTQLPLPENANIKESEAASAAMPTESAKPVHSDPVARKFYGFMGSQLEDLEKTLSEQMATFDDMNKKWKDEREAKQKKIVQEHVPGPLKNDGQSLGNVSKKIAGLFKYTNFEERYPEKPEQKNNPVEEMNAALQEFQNEISKLRTEGAEGEKTTEEASEAKEEEHEDDEFTNVELRPSSLPELTELEQSLLLSHSLAAYVTKLPSDHRERFYTRIINDTTHWLTSLFRVKDSTAFYHDSTSDGVISMARIALTTKYPDYLEKGFDSLYSRPPVIYISDASPPGYAQLLSRGLGLPTSCICRVPCKTPAPGQMHKMDTEQFESLVNDHIASTREPLMIIAYASTPVLATVDPLLKLKSICKEKNIWLHVEGLNLASLILMNIPTDMVPVRTSDSCTLNLASWFGLTGCPNVTFYRQESEEKAALLNLDLQSRQLRLNCFPLWVALQAVGVDGLVERVKTAVKMTSIMLEELSKISTISILNKKPKDSNSKPITSLGDILGRLISTFLIFEMATPVVVFTYGKSRNTEKAAAASYASDEELNKAAEEEDKLHRYYESLNIWFVETAKRECPNIHLETIKIDGYGTAIKFSPLEYSYTMGTTVEHVESFLDFTKAQVSIMDATVSHRQSFIEVVEAQDNLRFVELPGWAGIGAVQYIPTDWLNVLSDLPVQGRNEVNKINMELVHQLKANDSAFSLGRTDEGLACARFGLITQDTDMEDLLGLVYATGKEIEDSSRFVEQMAELVKKGIEQANQDLEKEQESRLMQEGVLRQVPLVSSLMNWWSPPPKEAANVKGRTFNLASGTIKSTEETYKNRMQILENQPETPKRQQPLKSVLKKVNNQPVSSESAAMSSAASSSNSTAEQSQSDVSSNSNSSVENSDASASQSDTSASQSNASPSQSNASTSESDASPRVEATEVTNEKINSDKEIDLK